MTEQISGLLYIDNFISPTEERELLTFINSQPWNTTLARRTQHYGYEYQYGVKELVPAAPIPEIFQRLSERLVEQGVLTILPEQVIVNEYRAGQGISKHVDDKRLFGPEVLSLSLGSDAVMEFENWGEVVPVTLKRRSVARMEGEARYRWTHCIPARKWDGPRKRGLRVSITFRTIRR